MPYERAEELHTRAQAVIRKFNHDLAHLEPADYVILWNIDERNPGHYAKIYMVPDRYKILGIPPLLVEVWKHGWEQSGPGKQNLILFHEFLHVFRNDNQELRLRKHDIEDFKLILRKVGVDWEKAEEQYARL